MIERAGGWRVAFRDRLHVQYEHGERVAVVQVDDGFPCNRVYTRTLVWLASDGAASAPTPDETAVIWPRLIEGMQAMGITPELFDG